MRVVYIFIISDHIKYMRVGGQGHCGRQGQRKILNTFNTLSISELAVDGTVVSKVNSEKKIREVADIRMYHIRWNFLQLGYDMLWWW